MIDDQDHYEVKLVNDKGDTFTFNPFQHEGFDSFLSGCKIVSDGVSEVVSNLACDEHCTYISESAVSEALSKILKIGVNMLTTGISGEISEWDLPKTTPKKTKRLIVEEADKWNEINRLRAIELKSAYDVLSKHFR